MSIRIQIRRDTATNWTGVNPILSQGEIGYETNTGKLKIGDGTTLWNALSYYSTSTLTTDQQDALDNANTPDASNPFATMNDIGTSVTPSALTKTNDTNVTLTLGGTPNTALLEPVSLTLGWTGTLADARIASAAVWNAKISSVAGTSNRITVTGSTALTVDIAATYVGQSSITTLGTITSGIWNGTAIDDTYISSATNWNTAFGWGDHASAGYLTSAIAFSTYVPLTRSLTINGTNLDLSSNRSWTVGDVSTGGSYSNPSWITALSWSKISSTPTTLSGYGITDAQPLDTTLTALAGLSTGSNKIPYSTGTDTFSQLTLDTDTTLATNSDTVLPSQKAVKTYADTKQPLSTAAYTMHVNNTNATANLADVTYKSFTNLTYSGTPTFTFSGSAPSGTSVIKYSWSQINKTVTFTLTCYYPTNGTGVTAVVFSLPTDMPNPLEPTGTGAADDLLYPCTGFMTTNYATRPTAAGFAELKVNSSDTGYEFRIGQPSHSNRYSVISGQYTSV